MHRHEIVATIAAPDVDNMVQSLQAATAPGTLPGTAQLEIRLDSLWSQAPTPEAATRDVAALLDAAGEQRLLATLRPTRQGGQYSGDETQRLNLLAAAASLGMSVDIEADHPQLPVLVEAIRSQAATATDGPAILTNPATITLSHHLAATPSAEDGLHHLTRMQDAKGDVHKLAFPATGFLGVLRAATLVHNHAKRTGKPCVMPMGDHPPEVRAALAAIGNVATYAHPPGEQPAALGQPDAKALDAVWTHWGLAAGRLGPIDGSQRGFPPETTTAPGWYAVIGSPIHQSLSPRMHNTMLQQAGLDERYVSLEVPRNHVMALTLNAANAGLRGISVTAPLKEEAARAATHTDSLVDAIGAANCIRFDPATNEAHATNTDATALQRLLKPCAGDAAVVLGTGGAARAAAWALQQLQCPTTIVGRDAAAAAAMAAAFEATSQAWPTNLRKGATGPLGQAGVLVNATPLRDQQLIPLLSTPNLVLDMTYGSGPSPLEQAGRSAGCQVVGGIDLLVEQGVDAFAFWTGQDADRQVMQDAVREASYASAQGAAVAT